MSRPPLFVIIREVSAASSSVSIVHSVHVPSDDFSTKLLAASGIITSDENLREQRKPSEIYGNRCHLAAVCVADELDSVV